MGMDEQSMINDIEESNCNCVNTQHGENGATREV
jgi:hypothetical protein